MIKSHRRFVVDNITPNDNNVTHRNYHNLDTGESPFDEEACVPVYRAVVEGDDIYLELAADDAAGASAGPAGDSGPDPDAV